MEEVIFNDPGLEEIEILHESCEFLTKYGILASFFILHDKLECQSCKNLARPCKSCKITTVL